MIACQMIEMRPDPHVLLDKAAARDARDRLARRVRGLSDRAIAWLFIAPTIVLLLAINIFPLIWTIRLSFTNYRANRPNARGRERRHRQLRLHPDRPGRLGGDAGDRAFRVLDDPAADAASASRSPT